MNFKKALIIIFAVIFFISALTSYINRVIFPRLIKKVAIERIENVLKRKVEIGSIHFNWVKGFIIDRIKIYEKDSDKIVFAQADQVSFGIILFPGLKHTKITIPFINVLSPSVHVIRTAENTWNFSDMLTPPNTSLTTSSKYSTPTNFEMAWGGITISNGEFLVNDTSSGRKWSEFFNNINLKLSLSYKGISYNFNADIPGKNGSIGATVYYQPLTKNTQAQIHLRNIDTASYLSLISIPDVHLESGIIKEIDLNIDHTQEKTSAQGNVIMKNLNITNQDQNLKGDIEIHDLDALYQDGDITAKGEISLSQIQTKVPGLSASGSIQTKIGDFELSKEGVSFTGSLQAQNILLSLKDRQVQVDAINLDNIKIKKDNDGIQSVGSISTKGLSIRWPQQTLHGDITLKEMTLRMKNENDIHVEGEIQADDFTTRIDNKNFNCKHIVFDNLKLNILDQQNVSFDTKLSIDQMSMILGNNTLSSATLSTNRLSFNLDKNIIKINTSLNSLKTKIVLDGSKVIEADPQLELSLQMPINELEKATYKGSITLSNGRLKGFTPIQSLDNIELDVDFNNDIATINALSINVLDTNVRITGEVKDFKKPFLKITADADELNLAKIKEIAPKLVDQYGLIFDGSSYVKVQFEGLLSDPLAANILAVTSVKNASITSTKLHQQINNITGIFEATPNSLRWRDTTATFQGKKYNFDGSLENFKNPKIQASLLGPNLQINADIAKNNNSFIINSLKGKYMKVTFNSTGNITLEPNQKPTFDINTNASLVLEDILTELPAEQQKILKLVNPTGIISFTNELKGDSFDWKDLSTNSTIASPIIHLMGYQLTDIKINLVQESGKIKNLTLDGKFYEGTVHAIGSLDLLAKGMPYDLAFNIDNTDLHQLKVDSPLKMQEINGKLFFTTILHGTIADFKNTLHATGSFAIRDGFLTEFNMFKGLLSILNDAMRLGSVMITDVEANFSIDNQKISTDNLRLKGPTIVLLGQGWVNFDQMCDLNMTVDLSSGVVPPIAQDVLKSLNIRIYDKITDPKFKRKISVPQVINTLIKNFLQ